MKMLVQEVGEELTISEGGHRGEKEERERLKKGIEKNTDKGSGECDDERCIVMTCQRNQQSGGKSVRYRVHVFRHFPGLPER